MNNILSNIVKLKNSKAKRVGRGIGTGKGKTCGRGVKGQKARTGCSISGFEGGQTPLYMRLPKKGFKRNHFNNKYQSVTIKQIERLFDNKRVDSRTIINKNILFKFGLVNNINKKIKLIMYKGEHKNFDFIVEVDYYSKNARNFIKNA